MNISAIRLRILGIHLTCLLAIPALLKFSLNMFLCLMTKIIFSNPLDFSQHSSRMALEQEARQCTLTMVATILQKCTELLVLARENSSNSQSYSSGVSPCEILGDASVFNMLLPNIFAHVSSIVSSDPKVKV